MNPVAAALIIVALLVAATVAGLVWRAHQGQVRSVRAQESSAQMVESVRASDLGLSKTTVAAFGARATLLQFSTEFCSYCPQTRVLLSKLANSHEGVTHLDIDLTHAPDIAQRFRVRQTPTTLLLDENQTIRARIGGPPRAASLIEHLDQILGDHHVAA